MKFTCDKCGKDFSTKSSLNRHKSYSKTCGSPTLRDKKFECNYCMKEFTIHSSLQRHLGICTEKRIYDIEEEYKEKLKRRKKNLKIAIEKISEQNKQISSLKKENKEMKEELDTHKGMVEGMKTAPDKKTIYNTAIHPKLVNLPINNIPALTREYMIEKVNNGILTYEKATKGYRGILEVICDLITHENDSGEIERNYVCTDVSRNSFHRLLESKKWKSDKGGRYLNNILDTFRDMMEEYKNKAYEIYNETLHDSFEWSQVDWERKNISLLYGGIVCKEGSSGREDLVNILRKEISKRAAV